ncbi:MAG: flagellar biosynthetic protein FliR [Planctomycetia bacterium]|nr:flagellar biosynthetic protein FliR [Planctomycetia bacterium]
MSWLIEFLSAEWLVFALVLARVSGLVITAPLFASLAVPARLRGLLALALAMLVAPMQLGAAPAPPGSLVDLAILAGGELLLGLVLGLSVSILLGGAQLAGQMIAQLSGLSLAEVFDPQFDTSLPVFSRFLHLTTVAVYLAIGGHRQLMAGLLSTFAAVPLGTGRPTGTSTDALVAVLSESFSLSIRTAAPAIIALLLATLVLGLVGRTLPQLNILAVGFGLNTLITFAALIVSLGALVWLVADEVPQGITLLLEAIACAGPGAGPPS